MVYVSFRTWIEQWAACRPLPPETDAGVDAGPGDAGAIDVVVDGGALDAGVSDAGG